MKIELVQQIPDNLSPLQADPRHVEDTGPGLYIVKQLVERNGGPPGLRPERAGGKISVRSRPGQGTTFMLEFKR